MSELDLLVRGGLAVLPDRLAHLDIGVHEGRIVALAPNLELKAAAVLEASGLIVVPGAVDVAGHYGTGGTFAPDSAALAAGGGACFADLPGLPGADDFLAFDKDGFLRKKEAALATSRLDFALWGAVSARNLYELAPLRDAGAVGFAAALGPPAQGGEGNSGLPLPPVPAAILGRAMKTAAKLRRPVLVHVEDGFAVARYRALPGGCDLYAASRPVETETAAVRTALDLAGEAGCTLLLAHVSTGESCALAAEARRRGVDVSIVSAPHYLLFGAEEAVGDEAHARRFRAAPPLRPAAVREELVAALAAGRIDLLASGHRPAGGISGCQHGFVDLWTRTALGTARANAGEGLAGITSLFSDRAARALGIAHRKGAIEIGRDADLALLDLAEPHPAEPGSLFYARRESAYAGMLFEGRIVRTLQRGRTVFANGELEEEPPEPPSRKVAKREKLCFIRPE